MHPIAVIQNVKECAACDECVAQCGQGYDFKARASFNAVLAQRVGNPHLDSLAFLSCHHCEKPLCIEACPKNVIVRTPYGVVITDASRCKGCLICSEACPWHVPTLKEDEAPIIKCNLCDGRAAREHRSTCVDSCPKGALRIQIVDELWAARQQYGAALLKRTVGVR